MKNTVTVSRITYPPAPKGWKPPHGGGFYFEVVEIATYGTDLDTVEEIDAEAARKFPLANRISVADAEHPAGWTCGSINGHP
jgi:hypothetical protein